MGCNGRGLNFVPGKQLVHRSECPRIELAGHGISTVYVRIDNRGKMDGFALLFKFVINAGMISPKGAGADHG